MVLKPNFGLFESGRFTHVLLYSLSKTENNMPQKKSKFGAHQENDVFEKILKGTNNSACMVGVPFNAVLISLRTDRHDSNNHKHNLRSLIYIFFKKILRSCF